MLSRALIVGALVWPTLLGVSVWARANDTYPAWTDVVYTAGARVCHQKPERSFHSAGVQWPVCARCTGLYVGAALGAIALAAGLRRRQPFNRLQALTILALAALPTAVTVVIEWTRVADPGNAGRMLAALPLGAAVAAVLIVTSRDGPQAKVRYTHPSMSGSGSSGQARAGAPEETSSMALRACLAAWLVPGAGHFLLGATRKAAVFFVVLSLMFVIGLAFGGRLFPFEPSDPLVFLAAAAQWLLLLPRLIGVFGKLGGGDVVAITYEYGNTFLIVAGLLNALVVLDVLDRARGRSRT